MQLTYSELSALGAVEMYQGEQTILWFVPVSLIKKGQYHMNGIPRGSSAAATANPPLADTDDRMDTGIPFAINPRRLIADHSGSLPQGGPFPQSIENRSIQAASYSQVEPGPEQAYWQQVQTQMHTLDFWLSGGRLPIVSPDQLQMLIRTKVLQSSIYVLSGIDRALLSQALTPDFIYETNLSLSEIPPECITPDMVLAAVAKDHYQFDQAPAYLQLDEHFYRQCRQSNPLVLSAKHPMPDEQELEALVRRDYYLLKKIPSHLITEKLCRIALEAEPKSVFPINCVPPDLEQFEEFCLEALDKHGSQLPVLHADKITPKMAHKAVTGRNPVDFENIPIRLITEELCIAAIEAGNIHSIVGKYYCHDIQAPYIQQIKKLIASSPRLQQAVIAEHRKLRYALVLLPDELLTEAMCQAHLNFYPSRIIDVPLDLLKSHRDWLLSGFITRPHQTWRLVGQCIEESDLDSFYGEAFPGNPETLWHVPQWLLSKHPEWPLQAVSLGVVGRSFIPNSCMTEQFFEWALRRTPRAAEYLPEAIRDKFLPELLAFAPSKVPQWVKSIICYTGDAAGLAWYTPFFEKEELLENFNPTQRVVRMLPIMDKLGTQLAANGPFQLPRVEVGQFMQASFMHHRENLVLPVQQELQGEGWQHYGSRTFFKETLDVCHRIKFCRKGEAQDEFVREEAFHRFFHEQFYDRNRLKGEVPKAVGLFLLPVGSLPESMTEPLAGIAETLTVNGQDYFLVYQFTTRDRHYHTLAHERGADNSTQAGEQGILTACHDLGYWASCGAMHTSTVPAYHLYSENRPMFYLTGLITSHSILPGALSSWRNRVTAQSDWGRNGLKDLGDLEFYPHIKSYIAAQDYRFHFPGYQQRVFFMNTITANFVAALLHYGELQADDRDYQYRNPDRLKRTALYIEQAINSFLEGFNSPLGHPRSHSPVNLKYYFDRYFPGEGDQIRQAWLEKVTKNLVYWTAKQSSDPQADCYLKHFTRDGKVSEEICDQKELDFITFKELNRDGALSLGMDFRPFPMLNLIEGLCFICSSLATDMQTGY